jgi:hypothetical protein
LGEIASGKAQQLAPATPPDPVLVLAAWALPLSETIGFSCGLPLAVRKQNSQHWNTGQHGTLLTFKHDIPLQNNSLAREKNIRLYGQREHVNSLMHHHVPYYSQDFTDNGESYSNFRHTQLSYWIVLVQLHPIDPLNVLNMLMMIPLNPSKSHKFP